MSHSLRHEWGFIEYFMVEQDKDNKFRNVFIFGIWNLEVKLGY